MKSSVQAVAGRAVVLLVGLLTLGLFAVVGYRATDGAGGVPLDDAWIHFQFARNLARGDGFAFNPGQPTAGSTAPLWTVLLAAVYRLGGRFPAAGQVMSGLGFLAALLAAYDLALYLTGDRYLAALAGLLAGLNGRLAWAGLSALETGPFAAVSLWAMLAHLRDRAAGRHRARTALLFGLAALLRPEGYLLFALAVGERLLARPRRREVLALGLSGLLFLAVVAPYLIFSWRTSGHLLPNTFHAKATPGLPDLDFLSVAARYLILDGAVLLPFYLLGLGVLLRRAALLPLWSVGLVVGYAVVHAIPYQHGRYLMPLIPVNIVIGIAGWQWARRRRLRRWKRGAAAVVALIVISGGAQLPSLARSYGQNVAEINRMHVATGRWLAAHTPPDALLALNDIGAIAYLSERPVVDLAGLVTPEVVPLLHSPQRDALLREFILSRGVDYVVIFPTWFPGLARAGWEPVYQVHVEQRTIAGGDTLVVYRVTE